MVRDDLDEGTMNSFNNGQIHYYLHLCRRFPGDMGYRQSLKECLDNRRRYRSDEPMTVYLVDFGSDEVWFESMEDVQSWLDNLDYDDPPKVTTGTMTGREFGKLDCWER